MALSTCSYGVLGDLLPDLDRASLSSWKSEVQSGASDGQA